MCDHKGKEERRNEQRENEGDRIKRKSVTRCKIGVDLRTGMITVESTGMDEGNENFARKFPMDGRLQAGVETG